MSSAARQQQHSSLADDGLGSPPSRSPHNRWGADSRREQTQKLQNKLTFQKRSADSHSRGCGPNHNEQRTWPFQMTGSAESYSHGGVPTRPTRTSNEQRRRPFQITRTLLLLYIVFLDHLAQKLSYLNNNATKHSIKSKYKHV